MCPNRKEIAIITVAYKSYDDTVRLVRSVTALRWERPIRVVVVNNSTDEESRALLDGLEKEFGDRVDIVIIHSPWNLGYFGGLNYGLPSALTVSPEWIVCCNADIIFTQVDFVEQLSQLNVDENVLVLAPAITRRNGRNQNPYFLKRPSIVRWLLYDIWFSCYPIFLLIFLINAMKNLVRGGRGRKPSQSPNTPVQIYATHGACFILNNHYFDLYPCLDDTLMLYGEEIILAETVRHGRGRILFVPTLKVQHNESGNIARHIGQTSYRAFKLLQKAHRYVRKRYLSLAGTQGDIDNTRSKQLAYEQSKDSRMDYRRH